LRRVDQDDASAGAMRPHREESGEVAHLLDPDLVALFLPRLGPLLLRRFRGHALWHDQAEIGVVALGKPATSQAAAAGAAVGLGALAQKGLGECPRELEFTPAVSSVDEHCVG